MSLNNMFSICECTLTRIITQNLYPCGLMSLATTCKQTPRLNILGVVTHGRLHALCYGEFECCDSILTFAQFLLLFNVLLCMIMS